MIQRIFLDFGGCIDAPGIHTRTLFWDAFLLPSEQREEFQLAYTKADQRMMQTGEAKHMGLAEFNRWNSLLISQYLNLDETASARAGDRVTSSMRGYLSKSRSALKVLKEQFKLSVISNFTGNLEVIMKEFQLRDFFDSVTESYYVGASKPDLKIFREALSKHDEQPSQCLYIGDNPKNDIFPAKELGMKTALIHVPGKRAECGADFYLDNLGALSSLIQSK